MRAWDQRVSREGTPHLTENRTCATIPSFEERDVCRVEEDRWTWRPWKPLLQGKREGRFVVAVKVANKVPKGAKTTPFGNQIPTETPCFISGLRVAVKTAKPLCAGSIPARASNSSSIKSMFSKVKVVFHRHPQVCLFRTQSWSIGKNWARLGRGSDQNRTVVAPQMVQPRRRL